MRVALGIICKNEEFYLSRILPIIRNSFDEFVALDTGSTDRTKGILKNYDCRIFEKPWDGNFSNARNEMLKYVTSDWVVVLDADEAMLPKEIERLKSYMAETTYIDIPRYNFMIDHEHYTPEFFPDCQGRAFKIGLSYHYRSQIHSIVYRGGDEKSAWEMKYGIQVDDVFIYHYGACKPREETWLKFYNYDRILKGLPRLTSIPPEVDIGPPKEYPLFPRNHPLKGVPVKDTKNVVAIASAVDGWMDTWELEWLANTASACQTIIEVGSWKGRSTKALALSTPGILFAVDDWRGIDSDRMVNDGGAFSEKAFNDFKNNLIDEIRLGKVVSIRSDNAQAADVLKPILAARGLADMVFIDGEHSYESVSKDLKNYTPLLRSGGILCGHDYSPGFPGVMKAVEDLVPDWKIGSGTIWYAIKP